MHPRLFTTLCTVDRDHVSRWHLCVQAPEAFHPRPGLCTSNDPMIVHSSSHLHLNTCLDGPNRAATTSYPRPPHLVVSVSPSCHILPPALTSCSLHHTPLLFPAPHTHPHPPLPPCTNPQVDALLTRFPDLRQGMGMVRVPLALVVGHLAAVYEGEGEAAGEGETIPDLEEHLGHLR